ncbi:unnamed protein product [Orchesella dallaii]|uniref:C2H2-type domain-containing protein n=1 Tax=Orchesella dallaii TaxID=48710 RepID=A0ABP1PVE6_9HEXA
MKKHLNLHSILSSRRVTTYFCGRLMRSNIMRLHMKQYHEGSKQPQQNRNESLQPPIGTPYYCDHCQMIFTKLYNLCLHFKAFHLEKVGYVHCTQPKCEGKFENQQLLHFHLDKVHGVGVEMSLRKAKRMSNGLIVRQGESTSKFEVQIHLNSFHTGRYEAIDYPLGIYFRIENPEGDDDDTSASKYCREFCPLVFPNHMAVHKHLLVEQYEALTYCCGRTTSSSLILSGAEWN